MTGGQGAWLYNLKDWIDRKWMGKYGTDLPAVGSMAPPVSSRAGPAGAAVAAAAGPEAVSLLASAGMRCGGCGSKVGSEAAIQALFCRPC